MRLWSIAPHYLDTKGLLAVWREGLLAQSVLLKGEYTQCSKCLGLGKYDEFENKKEWQRYIDCNVCKRTGKIKTPYWNHPALNRFKESDKPVFNLRIYLLYIYIEAKLRGYNFDGSKINIPNKLKENHVPRLTVTKEQLKYEFKHLQNKLEKRDKLQYKMNEGNVIHAISNNKYWIDNIKSHPLFKIIDGNVESWEKIK